ncbi:MAG: TIGR00725 family protein [Candidatus Omnitrophota bacterium]
MNIAVIGGNTCSKRIYKVGQRTGELIAEQGWILICGGGGGVMEAACFGAKLRGGSTVGILPGRDKGGANQHIDVIIPSGLGYARNILVVRAADSVIAIDGRYGTLSEIAFALNEDVPVYGINTWDIKGVKKVQTPQQAIWQIKKSDRRKAFKRKGK